jgi:hypothetical protein
VLRGTTFSFVPVPLDTGTPLVLSTGPETASFSSAMDPGAFFIANSFFVTFGGHILTDNSTIVNPTVPTFGTLPEGLLNFSGTALFNQVVLNPGVLTLSPCGLSRGPIPVVPAEEPTADAEKPAE